MTDAYDETKQLVHKIADYIKPKKIILFGSVSRNQHSKKSDIDLLIIKNTPKHRHIRIKEVFEAVRGMKRDYPLDPLVYTQEEIDHRLALGDYFITSVMNQGKIMYEQ